MGAAIAAITASFLRLPHLPPAAHQQIPNPGASIHAAKRIPPCPSAAAFRDIVEMFITTSTAVFPGVIAPEGENRHCPPGGIPPVHASVTALLNGPPTGWIIRLYGPEVCPAVTVWLAVADVTVKSGAIVIEKLALWLGSPPLSTVFTLITYVPVVALFGTVTVAVRVAVPPLARLIALDGESVQNAPESGLASQDVVMLPL